ncbi:MAG TPA: PAS domain-containing protein [Planctomycetota bacterium]|nr:PAS domain-containing protein [Planctomycetota bacterium]
MHIEFHSGFFEKARQHSEQQRLDVLLDLMGAIDEVLWIRDLSEERILYVSPGFSKLWGRPVESLLATPQVWVESIHPEDRERVLSAAMVQAREGVDHIRYRIVRPDGSVRQVHDRSYPIRNAAGKICRIAGLVEDITDPRPR